MDSPPRLRSSRDISDALRKEYPRELRAAGVRGTALVAFLIQADGTVADEVTVERSSGHPELDQAAVRVVRRLEFVPAWIHEGEGHCRVPVRTSLAIPFGSTL